MRNPFDFAALLEVDDTTVYSLHEYDEARVGISRQELLDEAEESRLHVEWQDRIDAGIEQRVPDMTDEEWDRWESDYNRFYDR
jgi:hypothetical protein